MQVTLKRGQFGSYLLVADNRQDVLIQTDWDFPLVASNLGFNPCPHCSETDGTVDCRHRTASAMIEDARKFLDDHIGESFEDPGYFAE